MLTIFDYLSTAYPTGMPEWTTSNTVVLKTDAFMLRLFKATGDGKSTLIIPPQAGHHSTIADYDNNQSMVETILKKRDGDVYCIEWLSCTQSRKYETIEDLVCQVDAAVNLIGKCHIVGLCQGGWLATIYTVLHQSKLYSLTPVASPIDFHKGGGVIYKTITDQGMQPYRDCVRLNNGIMPGKMMLLCWKLMHPVDRFLGDYVDIYTDMLLGNSKKMKKVKRFRTWYENTLDLAGDGWYLWACEYLFLKNLLVKCEISVGETIVDISKITIPVAMLAGENDDITLESHLFALGDHISSESTYKKTIPNCGHIGCFMGTKSQSFIGDCVEWIDKTI